jgi:hypothetical protein
MASVTRCTTLVTAPENLKFGCKKNAKITPDVQGAVNLIV